MRAIDMLSRGTAELVVLDLGLPDVDGLDVLRAARSRHQQVPVVVLTARGPLTTVSGDFSQALMTTSRNLSAPRKSSLGSGQC
ncbi:hypothetical protein GCM10029964_056690 [Kibdelosporangium lantanae]